MGRSQKKPDTKTASGESQEETEVMKSEQWQALGSGGGQGDQFAGGP